MSLNLFCATLKTQEETKKTRLLHVLVCYVVFHCPHTDHSAVCLRGVPESDAGGAIRPMGSYCSGLNHRGRHLQCLKTVINCEVLRLKVFNSEGEFCPRSTANEPG